MHSFCCFIFLIKVKNEHLFEKFVVLMSGEVIFQTDLRLENCSMKNVQKKKGIYIHDYILSEVRIQQYVEFGHLKQRIFATVSSKMMFA